MGRGGELASPVLSASRVPRGAEMATRRKTATPRPRAVEGQPDGMGHRMSALRDALACIRLLASGRWRVDDLAAELGCTRRTAYRLLGALRESGIHVERQREDYRTVYLRVDRAQAARALGLG